MSWERVEEEKDAMTNQEVFKKIEDFVSENLKGVPFDKGLPHLQKFVWNLGKEVGKTGSEVLMMYFDIKSKEMKK